MNMAKTSRAGLMMLSVLGVAACATTDTISRKIVDAETRTVTKFNCGDIYIHRTSADIRAGTVIVNQAPIVPTADLSRYSPQTRAYIKACNENRTIYAGHTQPIVSVGIGVTKVVGGGNTNNNLYGSQAISGSVSEAGAGANANASSESTH